MTRKSKREIESDLEELEATDAEEPSDMAQYVAERLREEDTQE